MHLTMRLDSYAPLLGGADDEAPGWSDVRGLTAIAQAAEAAALDAIVIPDPRDSVLAASTADACLAPITVAALLAASTTHIGTIAALAAADHEPYNVARYFASLDHLSAGRTGWNLSVEAPDTRGNAASDARDAEFLDVQIQLWDSWRDDAVINDVAAGVWAVPTRISPIDFTGEHFTVKGPLTMARPPQGRPVLMRTANADESVGLPEPPLDVAVVTSPGQAKEVGATLLRAAHSTLGGSRPKVLVRAVPVVADSEAEAEALALDLDELEATRSAARPVRLIGTPEQVAEQMATWTTDGTCDGFEILPLSLGKHLRTFLEQVVPILVARNSFRATYTESTLRGHLGLTRPTGRAQ